MATAVVMPRAGISVESCIIGQWRKKPGDKVDLGEVLFDYETDKASFECESTAEGTLVECFFESGDEVPCLTAVCAVGQPGEDVSDLRPSSGFCEPADNRVPSLDETANPEAWKPDIQVDRDFAGASPRARMLAERLGVNPEQADPTGPRGWVIARDIDRLADRLKTGTGFGGRDFGGQTEPTLSADTGYIDEKPSTIRKAIAGAMRKSISGIAQLTHHHSFDASGIIAYRSVCKAGASTLNTDGITLGDMVLFAVSRTLLSHPRLNAHMLEDDTLRKFSAVNLGVAVDTPRGLMVPTIFGADKMSLREISDKSKELAQLCQTGGISPDLLQGGTFTVSNLGSMGVEGFTPIINPPQVGILGVCGLTAKLRLDKDGKAIPYQAMGLSLTYDHCAVDGAPAARFVSDLCKNLEQFSLLLAG